MTHSLETRRSLKNMTHSVFGRCLSWILVTGQVLLAVPMASAAVTEEKAKPEARAIPAPPSVKVNRTVPKVTPPPSRPTFSLSPTDEEIFRAHVFEEPLVPARATSPAENQALSRALLAYVDGGGGEAVAPLDGFLRVYPQTAWRVALLTDLGIVYRRTGYFTKALSAWDEAWRLGKGETNPRVRGLAERAVSELAELYSRLGRTDTLEALLKDLEGRDVGGSASERLSGAREGVWQMRNTPGKAFRCGPLSLERILASKLGREPGEAKLTDAQSTPQGTSLAQMEALATNVGLGLRMARREDPAAEIPAPAMVHWKAGHFAALVRSEGGRYLVQDPTFGGDLWVTRRALEVEASGHFLVPEGTLPAGWRPVAQEEGSGVWGRGVFTSLNQNATTPSSPKAKPPGGCPPMALYNMHLLLASLNVTDTPLRYTPPRGPAVAFGVTYNQREAFQPQVFAYSNLGPKWTFDWLSYVEDDPTNGNADVKVYARGGGREPYSGYNPATQSYSPHYQTMAVVVRTSPSPIYERRLPDGSVEVFSQSDGAAAAPRKVFMTQSIDPQGNSVSFTYDANFRVVAVTDALQQVTTLSYELPSDTRKITKVTDPFGRFATFDYNGAGQLQRITDVIGIASEFTYGPGDFVTSLTTPYGTTSFSFAASGLDRWLEATDPLGGTERLEYVNQTTEVVDPPATLIPTGFPGTGAWEMGNGVTFYWDKRASALYPGDRTKASLTHWLRHDLPTAAMGTDIIGAEKKPLENWVFYPGATNPPDAGGKFAGPNARPTRVGRVLDDPDGGGPLVGPSQIYIYAYNARGLKIKEIDPLGRETAYFYGTGTSVDPDQTIGTGIDLMQVKQKNGATSDILEEYTYNSQHKPLTRKDAAGKTTIYTYTAQGQLATITTPPRAGIIENRTTTYEYFPDNAPLGPGRLQRVTGPASGATTTYTYDGYGRPRTVTDSEGYALTMDYDALDRPTRVTYPDGTYDQTVYSRLDAQDQRDRLGRWSHTFHDALRRPVSMRDPANRTTTQQWCSCGSLDKVIDANGNATSWDRDVQGRVTKETRADASFYTFTYETTTSRLKTRTDPKLQVTTYTYFLDNNLSQTAYTNTTIPTPTVSFAYDSVYNRLSSMTDGTGTTSYAYYPITVLGAGRLQAVDGPLGHDTVSYSYDELGRITTRGLTDFSTTSGYDVLGRLTPLGSPLGNFAWTYVNTTGRPQTVTYPNGQVTTYGYFNNVGDQRLQQIKHQQTAGGTVLSQFDYTYDPVGNISTWRQQFGITRQKLYALDYDAADQLTSAVQKDASTLQILKNYGYAYDPAGNKTVDAQDSTATTSQYNSRNELTQQTAGAALPVGGTLNEPATVTVSGTPGSVNAANQFAGAAQVGTGTQTFNVVATDPSGNPRTNTYQVNVSGTAQTFVYDANGNQCAKGGTTCTNGTTTYDWDAENRLVAVKQGSTTLASFVYDGTGRRAQKIAGGVTRSYVYDGENIIQERLSSGPTYDYVQGPGIDRPLAQRDQAAVVSYYLADHLGSIAQTTSSAGAVTLTRAYDPWGNMLQGASVGGYAFTGREWDPETGLYYYRARYYDPKIGRFLSEDPIGFDTGDPNFYAYVKSNPINWTDPFGLLCLAATGGPSPSPVPALPKPCPDPECLNKALVTYLECVNQAWSQFLKVSTSLGADLAACKYVPEPRARIACVAAYTLALAAVTLDYDRKKFRCLYALENDLDKCFAPCR